MKSPNTHTEWLNLIESFHNDGWSRKEANEILDQIYPDFKRFNTIHRSKCKVCNGNIIKFDAIYIAHFPIPETKFEFHNTNCIRKQKLLKINDYAN